MYEGRVVCEPCDNNEVLPLPHTSVGVPDGDNASNYLTFINNKYFNTIFDTHHVENVTISFDNTRRTSVR